MNTLIIDDQNLLPYQIDQIFAFIATNEEGQEGILCQQIGGVAIPFLATDQARIDQLMPLAQAMASHTDKQIRLVRFHHREELKLITPQ